MNSFSVAVATPTAVHPCPTSSLATHPVVLQPQMLDRAGCLAFEAALHDALYRASAVIVDFIWLETIEPDGIAILKDALHLADRLGKSIGFEGASFAVSAALEEEYDRLRADNLGDWQHQYHPDFGAFLRDRCGWQSETATIPDGAIVFPTFAATRKIA